MIGSRRVFGCAAAAIGVAALLAGCGGGGTTSSAGSSAASATPTIAPNAPTAFDGCKLPQSVIDTEHLSSGDDSNSDSAGNGGVKWRGCTWAADEGDGYGANIRTTNITIPMIRASSKWKIVETLTIDGRQTVTYQEANQIDPLKFCWLETEMKGGGLEIAITNDETNKATGGQASCDIAKRLAGELVPTFPASA